MNNGERLLTRSLAREISEPPAQATRMEQLQGYTLLRRRALDYFEAGELSAEQFLFLRRVLTNQTPRRC